MAKTNEFGIPLNADGQELFNYDCRYCSKNECGGCGSCEDCSECDRCGN